MQHEGEAENLTTTHEPVTMHASDAHVEELIETCSLVTVLAYAAMRLPPLPEYMDSDCLENMTRSTVQAREAETVAPVSGVVRRDRKRVV